MTAYTAITELPLPMALQNTLLNTLYTALSWADWACCHV